MKSKQFDALSGGIPQDPAGAACSATFIAAASTPRVTSRGVV